MLKEFKAFVMRGNVLDLAVAVIIGGAFGKIIASLVNDIIMPIDRTDDGRRKFQRTIHHRWSGCYQMGRLRTNHR